MSQSGKVTIMVEVFKTTVLHREYANILIDEINKVFPTYRVNFDLDDCDNILRVESSTGRIHAEQIIDLLKCHGFEAEILADTQPIETLALIP